MNQPSHPIPISKLLPADALPDDALRLHATRAVVEVREGRGHRGVERQQLLLTRLFEWRRFIRNVIKTKQWIGFDGKILTRKPHMKNGKITLVSGLRFYLKPIHWTKQSIPLSGGSLPEWCMDAARGWWWQYTPVYSSLCDSLFCVHQSISQVQRAIIHNLHTR